MLIAISGIDGCGKTLQVNLLNNWLKKNGRNPVILKAYDDLAKISLRAFIETWSDDVAIMFLFQALHAQQYALTSDALKRGDTVIADRWDESYLAYHQNFGFLSSQDNLRVTLNSLAFRDRLPDLGFVIHVSIEIARKRRESRGKLERFEDRTDAYYDLVQKTYCEIAAARGWHLLDGRETPEKIHEKIIKFLL